MTKKKEKFHTFSDSGICIKDDISLSVEKRFFSLKPLLLSGIALLGVIGGICTFLSYFNFEYNKDILVMITTIFFIVVSVILNLPGRLKFLIIPICILYETVLMRQRDELIDGFKVVCNEIARTLKITGENMMYYYVDSSIDAEKVSTLFFIFAIFIYVVLVCYATYCNVHFLFGIMVTFMPVEAGLYFGLSPSYPAFIMTASYWLAIITYGYSGCHNNSANKSVGFIRFGNNFYAKASIKFRVSEISGLTMGGITALVIAVVITVTNLTSYKRPERADEIRTNFTEAVEEFSTDNIPESLSRVTSSFGNNSLSPGKLGQHANLKFKDETDLKVSVDMLPENAVYLRCFSGSNYTSSSWTDFSEDTYNNYQTLFNEFEKNKIYPQNFLNTFLYNINNSAEYTLKVESVMKRPRHIYTPYGADTKDLINIYDSGIDSENYKNYSLDFIYAGSLENLVADVFTATVDKSDESFIKTSELEEKYREFVYNEYLTLPENPAIEQLRDVYSELIEQSSSIFNKGYIKTENDNSISIEYNNSDVYGMLYIIRNIISLDTEYTLSPGKTPSTRDFVNYFLLENKKGYCSHYASAGVVLARMCGIPARYAEGYIITDNDFAEASESNGMYTVEVKDTRAHAWAEIYIDGLGWIPFEFTPGYQAEEVPFVTTNSTEDTVSETIVTETVTETITTEISESTVTTTELIEEVINDSENDSDNDNSILSLINKNKVILGIIIGVVFAIFVFAFVMIIFLIRRSLSIRKRMKSFNGKNQNQNTVNAYVYMLSLLEITGVQNNSNMAYLDFAEYVEETTDLFEKGEFVNATRTALKSDMSNHKVSKNEAGVVIKLAERIAEAINESINSKQRFYLRYIANKL